jgi:hypothetical protein
VGSIERHCPALMFAARRGGNPATARLWYERFIAAGARAE